MDEQRKDRRGDRRGGVPEYMCPRNAYRRRRGLDLGPVTENPTSNEIRDGRAACRGKRGEDEDGTVFCAVCGAVDERGTEGNRRQAADELGALQRRIERELDGFHRRLDAAATDAAALDQVKAGVSDVRTLSGRVAKLERAALGDHPAPVEEMPARYYVSGVAFGGAEDFRLYDRLTGQSVSVPGRQVGTAAARVLNGLGVL